jgi:hypothetical protein
MPINTEQDTTLITLKMTQKELQLLTALASDQIFRLEFIDSKLPGFKSRSGDIAMAKALIARMRGTVDPGAASRVAGTTVRIAQTRQRRAGG